MARGDGAKKSESKKVEEPTAGATEASKVENEEVPGGAAVQEDKVQEAPEVPTMANVEVAKAAPTIATAVIKPKLYKIVLMEQDSTDKNQDQLVTDPSNGRQYLIKRGFEVEVPIGVVNNLKEAVQPRLEYDENGDEQWRDIPRFAIQFNGEVA